MEDLALGHNRMEDAVKSHGQDGRDIIHHENHEEFHAKSLRRRVGK